MKCLPPCSSSMTRVFIPTSWLYKHQIDLVKNTSTPATCHQTCTQPVYPGILRLQTNQRERAKRRRRRRRHRHHHLHARNNLSAICVGFSIVNNNNNRYNNIAGVGRSRRCSFGVRLVGIPLVALPPRFQQHSKTPIRLDTILLSNCVSEKYQQHQLIVIINGAWICRLKKCLPP